MADALHALVVEIQGREFYGTWGPDTVHYGIESMSGWAAGAEPRTIDGSYEAADGGVEGRVDMTNLSIRIEGDITTGSPEELARAVEDLGSILTAPRWDWMVVVEEHLGLARQIRVRRDGRPQITPTSVSTAIYTLQLVSASATRVALSRSTAVLPLGGRETLVNEGTVPADLTMTIYGPTQPDLRLYVGTGEVWGYSQAIPAGQSRVVDFSAHTVKNPATDGGSRLAAVGDWPRLGPGATTVSLGGTGTGRAEFSWRSTWS